MPKRHSGGGRRFKQPFEWKTPRGTVKTAPGETVKDEWLEGWPAHRVGHEVQQARIAVDLDCVREAARSNRYGKE